MYLSDIVFAANPLVMLSTHDFVPDYNINSALMYLHVEQHVVRQCGMTQNI